MLNRESPGFIRGEHVKGEIEPLCGARVAARYDDPRSLVVEPCANYEVSVRVDGAEPLFFDALDLLRAVSTVALDLVYGPSPTQNAAVADIHDLTEGENP